MRSRLTLVVEVEHDRDYDPSGHFVWYFSDDEEEPETVNVEETWDVMVPTKWEVLEPDK